MKVIHSFVIFCEICISSENTTLEESCFKLRERFAFVQCNIVKRERFGQIFYKICDFSSSYCLNLNIYVVDDIAYSDLPVSIKLVLNLTIAKHKSYVAFKLYTLLQIKLKQCLKGKQCDKECQIK